MKKIFILIVSAVVVLLNAADFSLKDGQKKAFRFDAPEGKNAILFFHARIKLPHPAESWGKNVLEVKLNGKTLVAPLNKSEYLFDPQTVPYGKYKVCDSGRLFLKGDSDWEVFNAGKGELYSNIQLLNQTNKSELSNVFYSFAFKLDGLKEKGNVVTFKLAMPQELAAYSAEISAVAVKGFDNLITFNRDWMQSVYPWSFPSSFELGGVEKAVARNEHGFATFSVYAFTPQKFQLPSLPSEFQIYRLDNSNIPAKLKEAELRHIPNIGKPYVPELLTPLASGSSVDLPAGTTTFAVRLRKNVAGEFPAGTLPVKFKVLDIFLPEASKLPVENTMYIMASGTDSQNIYPEFLDYGMSMMLLSPWTAPIPLNIKQGKLTADFSKFDAIVKKYQSHGLSCKTLFFGTSEPIIRNIAKLTGETEDSEIFQKRFKEFVELFFNHADELGLMVYLSLYDEANFQKNVWGKTKLLTRIATSVPNSRMWSTVTELASAAYYYDALGYRKGRDMCITHPFQLYERKDDEIANGVLCPDQKVGNLRNRFAGEYESITSYPASNNRYAYGIRSYQGKIKYMMGFTFWWGNMYKGKDNVKPTKCYYVCYPFHEKVTGVRYSSVGWEAIRCGIDDMRYIVYAHELLKKKYGDEEARSKLNGIFNLPRYSSADFSPDHFNKIRQQLTDIILEYK
ncbi:MAG: hypothetical protein E7051_00495 [Lentisphaerae bacterium]|nr:hypothetical protein [Lentisphaerota bacterium]